MKRFFQHNCIIGNPLSNVDIPRTHMRKKNKRKRKIQFSIPTYFRSNQNK